MYDTKIPFRPSFLFTLFVISFALNWVWEMAQMAVYVGINGESWREAVLTCTVATLGDAAITLGIYAVCVFITTRRKTSAGRISYTTASLLGAACAVIIEKIALSSSYWRYTTQMPRVPVLNVGLWPILQLALLIPLSWWIVLRWNVARHKGDTSQRGINRGRLRLLIVAMLVLLQLQQGTRIVSAQTSALSSASRGAVVDETPPSQATTSTLNHYVDSTGGMTAEEAVAYALAHNGELQAARKELEAARSLVKQARLRANPTLDATGARQINGKDNQIMVTGALPLELGGRRATRVAVAEREFGVRQQLLADRERLLAAEVRSKFGEALAAVLKLGFTEDLLHTTQQGYKLVSARVIEGRTAPLEQNMVLVEVNRFRSLRETDEGKVEVALLELRNLMGMEPKEPLRLRGDFDDLISLLPSLDDATARALQARPDLLAMRAAESLAEAQIEQARSTGRLDASVTAGYQRMNSSFPVSGINETGQLQPVQDVFHFLTFGVSLTLPVRNKNQGAIEAAVSQAEAAKQRREFSELTVRREVAAAYARYERAARAAEIFRVGVRGQANKNLDVVRQTYELGSKTLLDYISEERRFIEIETGYIDALFDTFQARVEIERATAAPELIKR